MQAKVNSEKDKEIENLKLHLEGISVVLFFVYKNQNNENGEGVIMGLTVENEGLRAQLTNSQIQLGKMKRELMISKDDDWETMRDSSISKRKKKNLLVQSSPDPRPLGIVSSVLGD